jgi:hypothetical protein
MQNCVSVQRLSTELIWPNILVNNGQGVFINSYVTFNEDN